MEVRTGDLAQDQLAEAMETRITRMS